MIDTAEILETCLRHRKISKKKLADISGKDKKIVYNIANGCECKVSTFETLLNAMGYELEVMEIEK